MIKIAIHDTVHEMAHDEARHGKGFGNMAAAICDGLLTKQVVDPGNIYACARDVDKLRAKCDRRGISALEETGFRHSLIYAIDKIMEKKH